MIILGQLAQTKWKGAALWFALALVGQAAALQMTDAGPSVKYQHFELPGRILSEGHFFPLVYLIAQTTFVVAAFKPILPEVRAWLQRNFRPWQLLGMGVAFFLTSATVSPEVTRYGAELLFATFVQAVNLANIVLVVWRLPEESLAWLKQKFDTWFGRPQGNEGKQATSLDRLVVMAAVWVTLLASLLGYFSYQRHPHIPDEVVYLYHARYLASGMISMPAPPVPAAFDLDLMNFESERWFSPVPLGWPLMLTVGVLLSAAWMVNPVLAGVNVLLINVLLRELYDRRTARMAVLLLSVSPWYIFMGMNLMPHMFTLTCALTAAIGIAWARNTGRAGWGWLSGMATGMAGLIRPLDGLIVGGLVGLWAIGLGGRRLKITSIAGLVVGSVLVGAITLPYNRVLTGDPKVFPIMAYNDKYHGLNSNAYGFGPDRGMGWAIDPYPGHGPIDALINANLNTFAINTELFGWSTGSLVLIILIVFSGAVRGGDYHMLAVIAAVFSAYFFYYFSGGPDFGARYWFFMLVPCLALTVRGVQFLERMLPDAAIYGSTRAIAAVLSLSLIALCNFFPWRAIDKYFHYRGMRPDIRILAKEYGFGKSLVLIRGNRDTDYASAATYNPVDLYADAPVYAWDRNAEVRSQLLRAYPERRVWIVNGPSITHSGFQVLQGPLTAYETAKIISPAASN
ncbi:MAG TPA: glycosyltransferase family 39 protein [Candidatus Binatia bacterium]